MWSASAELGLRCPLFVYWSLTPHAGQCVMPSACALASTCFLNCLCSLVLVLLTAILFFSFCLLFVLGGGASQRQRDERLHRLTLLAFSLLLFSPLLSSLFCSVLCVCGIGVCCVVRAQLCEHARDTTRALCVLGLSAVCGVCCVLPQHSVHC